MKRLCQVLDIARSSFYHWQATEPARAERLTADQQLAERIRAVHAASDGTYGAPRITAELRERGERVNHKRIARLMRGAGLQGLRLRRRHRTTVPDPAAAKAPDLIGRRLGVQPAGAEWCADAGDRSKIIYVGTATTSCAVRESSVRCRAGVSARWMTWLPSGVQSVHCSGAVTQGHGSVTWLTCRETRPVGPVAGRQVCVAAPGHRVAGDTAPALAPTPPTKIAVAAVAGCHGRRPE
ncbi:IS3 family transposase [Dactylosporangium salmoneum]|uniref:HTH-like domain-containing protein n=1 Tax=Dactylosporangium salmoneum TaxID=53361 RepID=A0ABN3FWS1_9ACTN